MDEINKTFGNLPDCINNPFTKSSINSIRIYMTKGIFGTIYFGGTVGFKNSNTTGEQEFKGENLADIFIKIKAFCEQLED